LIGGTLIEKTITSKLKSCKYAENLEPRELTVTLDGGSVLRFRLRAMTNREAGDAFAAANVNNEWNGARYSRLSVFYALGGDRKILTGDPEGFYLDGKSQPVTQDWLDNDLDPEIYRAVVGLLNAKGNEPEAETKN
jgi:hypothetical protein